MVVSCAAIDGSFFFIYDWLAKLTPYATDGRYPDQQISMDEAREAVAATLGFKSDAHSPIALGE